jgi:hypothetical protein
MTEQQKIKAIIRRAYDVHVHIGPEIIPRRFNAQSLGKYEKNKIAGCVVKNHFYPTASMINGDEETDLLGGVVLNNGVGGMNPEAVYAASLISSKPIMIWFPTINAKNFLIKNKFEIAPEWVEDKNITLKSEGEARPVIVTRNSKLVSGAKLVIDMISNVGGVLATGHISPEESQMVAEYAISKGVKVIITHAIYQHIDMAVEQQTALAKLGCFIEQSYSMYSMDGIPISRIADQIKRVGVGSVILSSDVGQAFSVSPSEALEDFSRLLITEGFNIEELETMLVHNPKKLLGIL